MNFDELTTSLWLDPTFTVNVGVGLCIVAFIVGAFTLFYLDIEGLYDSWDKAVVSGLTLAFLAMSGLAVTGFVMADQDRRQGQEALSAAALETYGVELRSNATSALLDNRGLFHLVHGGAEQMREQAGTANLVLDDEDVRFTLSWNGEEWLLLDGGTENNPGEELPRVDAETAPVGDADGDN